MPVVSIHGVCRIAEFIVTTVLAIVAFSTLFVVFGLFNPGQSHEKAACDTCSTEKDSTTCGACLSVEKQTSSLDQAKRSANGDHR